MQTDFLTQFVYSILPAKKKTSNNWTSFNAPCCIHNGETADTRGRGGIIQNGDNVSYHCFNCQYKTSFVPGRPLSYKFRKLLSWLGASENDIRRMVIEAIRVKEFIELTNPVEQPKEEIVKYTPRPLPPEAVSFYGMVEFYELANKLDYPLQFMDAVNYLDQRCIDMTRYEFFWSPHHEHKMSHRVIIPFKWQGETIGYTARAIVDGIKPKYFNSHEPDFVFNVNEQKRDSKFVIVCEGPFDAMSVDGVAICGNHCSERQADIIDSLGREVIVVPDFDRSDGKWPGAKLVEQAIQFGWSVSFPVWAETCKDINEAVTKYGKLFTLRSILNERETSSLKIELRKRKYN